MNHESEKKPPLSIEEVESVLKFRKQEIELKSKFYEETKEYYARQLEHETILTQIEEQQYKRLEMKVRFAQFMSPPDQDAGTKKTTDNTESSKEKA